MIRSLYSAASGMVAQILKQDVIANNIANAQTPGFKKESAVSESFRETYESRLVRIAEIPRPPYPDSPVDPMRASARSYRDFSQGPIQNTGSDTDFAITGPGYFELTDASGGVSYTRAGNFHLDRERYISSADGLRMNGENGPIKVPEGEWHVSDDGTVVADGKDQDKIKIVGGKDKETQVMQGYIEASNVSIIREMVAMISNMRAYEANQKVVMASDETLGKAITEVGKA